MRAAVSNSVGTQKLKFNDVRDRILAEEVRRIDSGEASTSSAFNVENRGRNPDRNNRSNGRSKSRNGRGQSKFRQPAECWNCERQVTSRRIAEHHRRRKTTLEAEPMQ
ncbi:hypothetical protein Bca4012_102921 [Brassica carinata]